jgi:hypothetical protein
LSGAAAQEAVLKAILLDQGVIMSKTSILLTGILLLAWGCGGGGGQTNPPPAISVTLTPNTANVHVTRTVQFTATVHNSTNAAVTWSVSGTGCSGATCGTISSGGLYTAPASAPSPATVTVKATSAADSSKSSSATITILAAVVLTVSPLNQSVDIATTQQYTATVQNAVDSSVTWSVSGTACTGAACGTISTGGLYTAPSAVPTTPTISITATSVEDTAISDSVTATIVSSASIIAWPSKAQVTINASYQFDALVTGSTNTGVTWSVAGSGCSGTSCGTISTAGLYTAPGAVPSPATVTITVTSQVDPGKSASATVEIMPSDNAKLNGTYSYFYQGFANHAPAQTVGMFVADGNGHITYGVTDRTWPDYAGGNLLNLSFTGTYSMNSDNRGYLTLSLPWPYGSVTLAFVLNAAGDKAFIQPFFDVPTRMLGTMVKQDVSAFNNSAFQGDYVFQLLGADLGGTRIAALGRLHANGTGGVTSGSMDLNDGVSVQANLSLSGTYSVSANGRGTMALAIGSLGTFNYVFYILSADRSFISSIDTVTASAPQLSGPAFKQSGGPFSDASLQGTGVFDLLGRPAAGQAKASVGLLTSDGSGNITGVTDINTNGSVSNNTTYTATYAINASGRGTLTSATLPSMIFYLASPGTALLMEAPGAAVQIGSLEPQVQLTYTTALMLGQFVEGGSVPPPYADNQTVTAVLWYDAAGAINWVDDYNSTNGGLGTSGGGGSVASVASNGRAVLTDQYGNHGYVYLISPLKFVEIQGFVPQQALIDQNLLFRNERRP